MDILLSTSADKERGSRRLSISLAQDHTASKCQAVCGLQSSCLGHNPALIPGPSEDRQEQEEQQGLPVSPLHFPHVANWNNRVEALAGQQKRTHTPGSQEGGGWTRHSCCLVPSSTEALPLLVLEFPHEQDHWPSVPGIGPLLSIPSGPQAACFSLPFHTWSRYPTASSVKNIPKIPSVSSDPRHGDEAPLHDLQGKVACVAGEVAGAGRAAAFSRPACPHGGEVGTPPRSTWHWAWCSEWGHVHPRLIEYCVSTAIAK